MGGDEEDVCRKTRRREGKRVDRKPRPVRPSETSHKTVIHRPNDTRRDEGVQLKRPKMSGEERKRIKRRGIVRIGWDGG
jgi:hypothetical protein